MKNYHTALRGLRQELTSLARKKNLTSSISLPFWSIPETQSESSELDKEAPGALDSATQRLATRHSAWCGIALSSSC